MPVKLFHSAQVGAPTLAGQSGSLVDLLTACLVDGYPSAPVTSIVRDGSLCTVVTPKPHGFITGDYAAISGAGEGAYNGEHFVTLVNATTFTFAIATTPDTPATGAITFRRSSAGWERAFSGPSKAAYRSKEGLRHYLRVVDDASSPGATREAQLRGYRTMSSIDEGVEPFPTPAQRASLYAYKSTGADTSSRPWVLICDERIFYLGVQTNESPANRLWSGGGYPWWVSFGELASPTREVDSYMTVLGAMGDSNRHADPYIWNGAFMPIRRNGNEGNASTGFTLRGPNEVEGSPAQYNLWGHGWDEQALGNTAPLSYPHPTDNGFYVSPVRMVQNYTIRAVMPGLYESLHGNANGMVTDWSAFPGTIAGLEGRKVVCFHARNYTEVGLISFDVTGPWR